MKLTCQKPTFECTKEEAKIIYNFLDYLTYSCFEKEGYSYEQLIDCFSYCYENPRLRGNCFDLKIVE